ncbi:MAG: hypothetical protein ACOYLD_01630 [Anaerohalosphaeraceae bacterium]|jgi:hypothetical protein
MKSITASRIVALPSLLASLVGPVTLLFLYSRALLQPQEHASFIQRAGIAIYIVEFLSIHSSGMLLQDAQPKRKKEANRLFLFAVYTVFIFGSMFKLRCWFIGLYFFLSLCTKVFLSRCVADDITRSQLAFGCLNFLGCTFIVIILAPVLRNAFPLPQSIAAQHPNHASGLFVDTPQALLTWGILYFLAVLVFNIVVFLKHTTIPED